MHKRPLDVNAVICEVISMLDEQLRGSNIETTLALSDAAMIVPADRVQLQQVLINLVVNAIEALRRSCTGRGDCASFPAAIPRIA